MEYLSEISGSSIAIASALSAAAGAYINAKYSVSSDLASLYNERSWTNRLGQRIAQLGDTTTIYKMLERVVEVEGHGSAEALWFEHRTWTYTQLKDRT